MKIIKKHISRMLIAIFALNNMAYAQTGPVTLQEYQARTKADLALIASHSKEAEKIFTGPAANLETAIFSLIGILTGGSLAAQGDKASSEALLNILEGHSGKPELLDARGKTLKKIAQENNLKVPANDPIFKIMIQSNDADALLRNIYANPKAKEEFYFLLLKEGFGEIHTLSVAQQNNLKVINDLASRNVMFKRTLESIVKVAQDDLGKEHFYTSALSFAKRTGNEPLKKMILRKTPSNLLVALEKYELSTNVSRMEKFNSKGAAEITQRLKNLSKNLTNRYDRQSLGIQNLYYSLKSKIYEDAAVLPEGAALVRNLEETIISQSPAFKYNTSAEGMETLLMKIAKIENSSMSYSEKMMKAMRTVTKSTRGPNPAVKPKDGVFLPKSLGRFGALLLVLTAGGALLNASNNNDGKLQRLYDNIALIDNAPAADLVLAAQDATLFEAYKTRSDIVNAVASSNEREIVQFSKIALNQQKQQSKAPSFKRTPQKSAVDAFSFKK